MSLNTVGELIKPNEVVDKDVIPVTVVMSSRNRDNSIARAIQSILAVNYPDFELCLIDQSENDLTERAVQPFMPDARFRYVRSSSRGAAAGRNEGIRLARGEIIAITDDDCEVPDNWLWEIARAFKLDSRIGAVFGNALPGEYEREAGFIPTYVREEPLLVGGLKKKNQARGIFACAATRREVWQAVGGFDEMLGPGAPYQACEDGDYIVKVLLGNYYVYETPQISVTHHGFRTWKEGRALAARNWYGTGACLVKYLKYKEWAIIPVIAYEYGFNALGVFLVNLIQKHRISGLTPIVEFIHGFVVGLFAPVNRSTGNYVLK